MEFFTSLINVLLHIDQHLNNIIQHFGIWSYVVLFFIVFCETGFVVTPFLPGDSLIFAASTLAAMGSFDPALLIGVFSTAAVLGDSVNYLIGMRIGPKIFSRKNVKLLNMNHLEKTRIFYEKHGGKTIIIARFIPIIRTFAPFVAGIGKMPYRRFFPYNLLGGILWPLLFVLAGYFFGNIPIVKRYLTFIIIAIIIISVMPVFVELARFTLLKMQNKFK